VPALVIASHAVPSRVGDRLLLDSLREGRPLELSRNAPDFASASGGMPLSLSDPFISRQPILVEAAGAGAIRLTPPAAGVELLADGEPIQGPRTFSVAEMEAGVALEIADRVVLVLCLVDPSSFAGDRMGMVGDSAAAWAMRRSIAQVADLDVTVLVRGETGTGKELVSRAIHQRSPRRGGPLVSVNLAALTREVAAAELFGARRGAFTGAVRDRDGLFAAARGGTLFLDEVGEATLELQAMLLRVLETGEMLPVGASEPVRTDVRLIAATDANLETLVEEGRFKAPLLHRLAGYQIAAPPLRVRRDDIGPLVLHFARQELEAIGEADRLDRKDPYAEPWLPARLSARLVRHPWPGNIRQLRNAVRQLVIESRGGKPLAADAPLPGGPAPAPAPATPAPPAGPGRRRSSEITEAELRAALAESEWDFKAAADRLGVPRSTIYDLIARFPGLRTAGALSAEEITRCHQECAGNLDEMARRLEVSKRALKRRVREMGLKLAE
jgi:two-component system nitrogen regulation response regulator GlnG